MNAIDTHAFCSKQGCMHAKTMPPTHMPHTNSRAVGVRHIIRHNPSTSWQRGFRCIAVLQCSHAGCIITGREYTGAAQHQWHAVNGAPFLHPQGPSSHLVACTARMLCEVENFWHHTHCVHVCEQRSLLGAACHHYPSTCNSQAHSYHMCVCQ